MISRVEFQNWALKNLRTLPDSKCENVFGALQTGLGSGVEEGDEYEQDA